MTEYTLGVKAGVTSLWGHDPSAAIFEEGELAFGVEEERFTRDKHAINTFPDQSIRACLDYCDVALTDIDRVIVPYEPRLAMKLLGHELKAPFATTSTLRALSRVPLTIRNIVRFRNYLRDIVAERLADIGTPVPDIKTQPHHRCHAASAFYPAEFEEGLVLTLDGRGEYDSSVVWYGSGDDLERERVYEYPNSLGTFFGVITKYLGYMPHNGEGKVMGLAPYGSPNKDIEVSLRSLIDTGVEYDVTDLVNGGFEAGVKRLEDLFDRPRNDTPGEFDEWHEDLAFTAQSLLEETAIEMVKTYCDRLGTNNVALAGGVILNCKLNKRIMELPVVDNLAIQPVAHDAGVALGAGMTQTQSDTPSFTNAYWGPAYDNEEIEAILERFKLDYYRPDNLSETVAKRLANGDLVGWFQGRLEMGPRALGNRSILADPRSAASRDRVNKYVKNREKWRPFAPSILKSAAEDYLENAEPSPFMIKTFDVREEVRDDVQAVLHPGDDTTRPQTVTREQNPRYYNLISAFEGETGVPVLLNTSFNDHSEPIVESPKQAIKDFYGMGLDLLVLEDLIVEK